MRITEKIFNIDFLNTIASQMVLGNGEIGIRGCHEEDYDNQDRGFFMNGIFNKPFGVNISELVNLPDVTKFQLIIDGEYFSLLNQKILSFDRYLDFSTGELRRIVKFQLNSGKNVTYLSKKLVSQKSNYFVQKIEIFSNDAPLKIKVVTGLNAQVSNYGAQHLVEKEIRVFNNNHIQANYETTSSKETVGYNIFFNKEGILQSKNRQVTAKFDKELTEGEHFQLEKFTHISSSLFSEGNPLSKIISYDEIYNQSVSYWKTFWEKNRVIVSGDQKSQDAIDFSIYHLNIMTPRGDNRLSVGAKGLTGLGYKGHVFWDTEIFILPFFLHTNPEIARNLLVYRFKNIQGAWNKAKKKGYKGALFPWESAFSGDEETPEFAAINIKTGLRQKVSSGDAEHHIVADIAFAVYDYYQSTHDETFMKEVGFQLIQETAAFWLSRCENVNGRFEIHSVIGPDEYTEYINNNAYTNYLAHFNVLLAQSYSLGDDEFQKRCKVFLENIYLPNINSNGILPQDDSFLSKPSINLSRYKATQGSQAILLDYSRQEVNEMQILKQADVMMLMYLFSNLFSLKEIENNFNYYEERTIHDSSLSKAIHAINAIRLDQLKLGQSLFEEATEIDLGTNPHSSDEGLHAAALASVWHVIVFGFAGIKKDKILEINPKLPENWTKLSFPFNWHGKDLLISISQNKLSITSDSDISVEIKVNGKNVVIEHSFLMQF
ncbi:glycosyl hydrolase family 65 protein [Streptococcus parauberis]|uniref:glycosyl hydrolase family 65 protein n=1 Tax=Streptococcus parauberis TaxID=1348 RepID=UPI000C1CC118|nr:glycosyl hydrolase family 65 protein [Streptococcus parauberis]PIO79410.1 Kojibiose phosphorylase [Streptococcus parauberis]POS67536.1 Kojibiose phosphorylase [Streptococcus parauberis]